MNEYVGSVSCESIIIGYIRSGLLMKAGFRLTSKFAVIWNKLIILYSFTQKLLNRIMKFDNNTAY